MGDDCGNIRSRHQGVEDAPPVLPTPFLFRVLARSFAEETLPRPVLLIFTRTLTLLSAVPMCRPDERSVAFRALPTLALIAVAVRVDVGDHRGVDEGDLRAVDCEDLHLLDLHLLVARVRTHEVDRGCHGVMVVAGVREHRYELGATSRNEEGDDVAVGHLYLWVVVLPEVALAHGHEHVGQDGVVWE